VPAVSSRIRGGRDAVGTILGYPLEALYEEVAFIAYHFHWDLDRVLDLEHEDRARWVAEISRINQRANEEAASG
jgi:Family of unknown function (DUF6760)